MQFCLLCSHAALNSIVILQWNCRSIRAQRDELLLLITQHNPHIIALCETWLKDSISFSLKNYKIIRKDRTDGYGGVMIACRNDIQATSVAINTCYECVVCSIELYQGEKLSVASVYFPPNLNNPPFSASDFEMLLNQIPDRKLILGDFNSHGQQWGGSLNDRRSQIITNVLDDNNLVTINTGEPTRIACPPTPASALDLSVCSTNLALNCNWNICDNPHGSDHFPIIISLLTSNSIQLNCCPRVNLIKHIMWEQFKNIIDNSPIYDDPATLENYDRFVTLIKDGALQAQSKPMSSHPPNLKFTPKVWWSDEIDSIYKEKKKHFMNLGELVVNWNF